MSLAAAFVRVSTGSQDETSQVKVIDDYAAQNDVTIVKTFKLHGYSASHGTQEPTLREAVEDIARGEYSALIVTESSRLDRREDLDAQPKSCSRFAPLVVTSSRLPSRSSRVPTSPGAS